MADPLGQRPAREQGTLSYLMDAVKVRPAGRRTLSALALVLCLGGAAMFAYPLFTDLYANNVLQQALEDKFSSDDFEQRYVTRTVKQGDPLTRVVIPKLGVNAVVVEGTSAAALRAGAGHYPNTPLPGERGNVAIAGHRTTYGKPFNRLDELVAGDKIRLETPLATYHYVVVPHPDEVDGQCPNGACWVTFPTDWSVVGTSTDALLTLTTCHPKGSAAQRLILRAALEKTGPPRSNLNS
jgi:sortase A